MSRPAHLQIDLAAIRSNIEMVRSLAPHSKVVACVKADAYGHGAPQVARALGEDADLLGLACLEELQPLESEGITTPALLLEGCFEKDEWQEASARGCAAVIHNQVQLDQFLSAKLPVPMPIWLKIDTGMHRLGLDPNQYMEAHKRLASSPNCRSLVQMSHFACSEELDNAFNEKQISVFTNTTGGIDSPRSIANSAAILTRPETHLDWVRPGYMLYGNSPMRAESPQDRGLKHAMSFVSKVIALRQIEAGEGVGYNHSWRADKNSTIAVVAAGYGDGYPRNSRNGTPLLIEGQLAHTVGHIAMDMLMVDITHLTNNASNSLSPISIGSQVELWGPNLPASKVAEHSNFSGYELLTRLTSRLARKYLN